MTTLQVHVGMGLDEMVDQFVSAYKRAETDRSLKEWHLSFETLEELASALTPDRLTMLRYLNQNSVKDVQQLAIGLKRDYKNVSQDVMMLEERGLIRREDINRLCTDFSEIQFNGRIAL